PPPGKPRHNSVSLRFFKNSNASKEPVQIRIRILLDIRSGNLTRSSHVDDHEIIIDVEVLSLSSSSYFPVMSKNDMKDRICSLSKNDLKDLMKTYRIPLDLHPRLPDLGFTMDHLSADAIGIYYEFFWFSGVRVPFLTFLLSVLKYFKVHISQLVPLGDWFSFSKRHNTENVCMDDGPSSLKKWKIKFFLIDRRAIPDHLTWRHSCSCVSDDLPSDGYDRNDVHRLCAPLIRLREMREEHTTAPAMEGAIISLPTLDEIAASLPYSHLVKKSKNPSHATRPSKKRKLQKSNLEAGSSALELDQAEGTNEADLADLCAEIEDRFEIDKGVSMRAVLAPTTRLSKRLGAPPSIAVVSAYEPSLVGTSAPASTSSRSLSLGGVVASGYVGKSRAEVMRRQMDSLDCLARSSLARDDEYDQIPDDDFGTATRGEEIDLTLFPLAHGPYHMHRKALDWTITPAKLRRTGSLLPLEFLNHVNVLSALLVSHGYGLNSRYANLVSSKAHLQEKLGKKKRDVKLLCLEVTSLDSKLENLQRGYDALGQENKELRSQRDAASEEIKLLPRDLKNDLVLKKSKSQGYNDVMDGLREEVTQFFGSGVASLVWKLLSSDEFHAALARVASLSIDYGVERGLRMGCTDVEFEAAVQKVSNFHAGAKADSDKALVDFPTTPFLFLSKIAAVSGCTLSDLAQIFPDKFVRSATSVSVAPSSVNEVPEQVPP
nr:hypothetical protein [Tanacetum cinerariifolium]